MDEQRDELGRTRLENFQRHLYLDGRHSSIEGLHERLVQAESRLQNVTFEHRKRLDELERQVRDLKFFGFILVCAVVGLAWKMYSRV